MMKNIRLRICTLAVLLLTGLTAMAQQLNVQGTVTDKATGESIIGASVMEAGMQNGVITDFDGKLSSRTLTASLRYPCRPMHRLPYPI